MPIPHSHLLDYLAPGNYRTQMMFGTHAVYVGDKIMFALRQRPKAPEDNGLWVNVPFEHHDSIRAEFPALTELRSIPLKKWLLLPETAEDFEEVAQQICLLVLAEDERIGSVPKPKKKKK